MPNARRVPLVLAGGLAALLAAGCGGKGATGARHASALPAPAGPMTVDGLVALARDPAAFRGLVDPARGILDEHDVSAPAQDLPDHEEDRHWVRRRCGADVQPLLDELAAVIVERAADDYHEKSCEPDGTGAEACFLPGAAEWDVSYSLGFVADGAGRRLAWVRASEVGSMGTPELDAQFDTELGAATPCP